MKLGKQLGIVVLLSALPLFGLPSRSEAIPAFARKYHTTCARCHSDMPRLNNYGWNFKLRGYHVPGDEEAGKIVSKDDPFLSLIKEIPLAVRVLGAVNQNNTSGMNPDVALNSYMDLIFADTLAPRMATFLEMETQKQATSNAFTADIGNVKLMFTDLVPSAPTAVNLEVGRFNPDEFGISDGRRLTQNHYAIFNTTVGANPFPFQNDVAGINIYGAFNTGIGVEAPNKPAPAAGTAAPVSSEETAALQHELEAHPPEAAAERPEITATRAALDVLVTKGLMTQDEENTTLANLATRLGPAPAPPPTAAPETPAAPAEAPISKTDYDVRKGVFYQLGLVTPGVASLNRYQFFGRLALASAANWWISPYIYSGTQGVSFAPTPGMPFDITRRMGLEASFSTGPHRDVAGVGRHALDLQAAVMHGSDALGTLGTQAQFNGGFLEGAYLINDRNLGILRWDRLNSVELPVIDVSTITANFTRYLRRNVKVGLEYVLDMQKTNANHQNSNMWSAFWEFVF